MSEQAGRSGSSRRLNKDRLFDAMLPVIATLIALAFGGVLLLILGVNPVTAYAAMFKGCLLYTSEPVPVAFRQGRW